MVDHLFTGFLVEAVNADVAVCLLGADVTLFVIAEVSFCTNTVDGFEGLLDGFNELLAGLAMFAGLEGLPYGPGDGPRDGLLEGLSELDGIADEMLEGRKELVAGFDGVTDVLKGLDGFSTVATLVGFNVNVKFCSCENCNLLNGVTVFLLFCVVGGYLIF